MRSDSVTITTTIYILQTTAGF